MFFLKYLGIQIGATCQRKHHPSGGVFFGYCDGLFNNQALRNGTVGSDTDGLDLLRTEGQRELGIQRAEVNGGFRGLAVGFHQADHSAAAIFRSLHSGDDHMVAVDAQTGIDLRQRAVVMGFLMSLQGVVQHLGCLKQGSIVLFQMRYDLVEEFLLALVQEFHLGVTVVLAVVIR